MEDEKRDEVTRTEEQPASSSPAPETKAVWHEPKLAFIEPKLTERGTLQKVTGFFGAFSP
jgi:hypothetical protein